MEHDLHAFALINPRPEAPVSFAVDLNARVGRSSQPIVIDQQTSATDSWIPAHLLVNRDLEVGPLGQLDCPDCFGVFVSERLLAQQMLAGCDGLLHNPKLLGGVNCNIHDLDVNVLYQLLDASVHF